jgi:hypothetical protein
MHLLACPVCYQALLQLHFQACLSLNPFYFARYSALPLLLLHLLLAVPAAALHVAAAAAAAPAAAS